MTTPTSPAEPCTHGHAGDPGLCPECRAAAAGKTNHVDPEIEAEWDRAAKALERRLRPYVQDLLRWDLARDFIRTLAAEGFRPPLRPPRPARPTGAAAAPTPAWRAAKAAIASKADP
jgi:hypothetical protein